MIILNPTAITRKTGRTLGSESVLGIASLAQLSEIYLFAYLSVMYNNKISVFKLIIMYVLFGRKCDLL